MSQRERCVRGTAITILSLTRTFHLLVRQIPGDEQHRHFGKGQTETTLDLDPRRAYASTPVCHRRSRAIRPYHCRHHHDNCGRVGWRAKYRNTGVWRTYIDFRADLNLLETNEASLSMIFMGKALYARFFRQCGTVRSQDQRYWGTLDGN